MKLSKSPLNNRLKRSDDVLLVPIDSDKIGIFYLIKLQYSSGSLKMESILAV